MNEQLNSKELDDKIAKALEEMQEAKKEKLIQLIIEVVVEATLKEFYELKEKEENAP